MDSKLSNQKILDLLKSVVLKENFDKCTISISGNSEKGDGFNGDITFVKICEKASNSKVQNFVVKYAKESLEFRKIMPVDVCFNNEIHFYTKVMPEFRQFQEENKVAVDLRFENVPKCFGAQNIERKEALIFEDLRTKEYILHNSKNGMNKEHIEKVLKAYANLHAISFALKDQKPKTFKQLADGFTDLIKKVSENNINVSDQVFDLVIELAKKEKESGIVEKCLHLAKTVNDVHKNTVDPNDPCNVILHGDCWNNNFLFKYEDKIKTNPSEVSLLDFQAGRVSSPVCDLSYFLFTTLSEKTVNYFDHFNSYYYECLSTSIKRLGSDAKKLFSFEMFMEHWKKYGVVGLVLMPSIVKVCLSEVDEIPDLEEAADSGKNVETLLDFEIKRSDDYRNRTLPIMKLAIEKRFC